MRRINNRNGFTIIELLISTVIFSLVLLVITTAIVQFSRIYYKGVIQSRTQQTARDIVADIAGNIRFSGDGTVARTGNVLCVGAKGYTFVLNQQISPTQHALVADSGTCTAHAPMGGPLVPSNPLDNSQRELLGENMQLMNIEVEQLHASNNNLYRLTVKVGYGRATDMTSGVCNAISRGGQFCATAELSTIVAKRKK